MPTKLTVIRECGSCVVVLMIYSVLSLVSDCKKKDECIILAQIEETRLIIAHVYLNNIQSQAILSGLELNGHLMFFFQ